MTPDAGPPAPIDTARLRLVPYAPAHLVALIEGPARFAAVFGHPAAPGLHELMTSDDVSPDWLAGLRAAEARGAGPDPWTFGYALLHRARGEVIGSASFAGPPDEAGEVEIAYGVAPAYEGQGYASEAAAALVSHTCADPRVRRLRAHTRARAGASPRILEKCGFACVGQVDVPEDGLVWRWERPRGLPAPAPR